MAKITLKGIAKKYLAKGVPVEDLEKAVKEWLIDGCSEELSPFPIDLAGKKGLVLNAPEDKVGRLTEGECSYLIKDYGDSWEGIWVKDCGGYVTIHDDTCGLHFTAILIFID